MIARRAVAAARRTWSKPVGAVLLAATVALAAGCAPSLRGTVDAERLRAVVERDAVVFERNEIPVAVAERLAAQRVVVVGEYHGITEHDAFVGEMLAELHGHGFRTLLLEYPQAYTWLLDGYARGLLDTPGEGALRTYGAMLERVRTLNAGLPTDAHLRVAAIDVNPVDDAFMPPFRGLVHQLDRPPILTEAVAAIDGGDDRRAVLAALASALDDEPDRWLETWSDTALTVVKDMIETELRSLDVRAARAGRARDAAREALMMATVDRYLARHPGGALVNVGYYHAQKESRDGTVDVWLGEHLVRSSPYAREDTFVLVVVPASGEKRFGARVRAFDVADDSPPNELFRVLSEHAGARVAFVALDDELFATERVVVNYLPRLDTQPPAGAFDGFVLLPEVRPANE